MIQFKPVVFVKYSQLQYKVEENTLHMDIQKLKNCISYPTRTHVHWKKEYGRMEAFTYQKLNFNTSIETHG